MGSRHTYIHLYTCVAYIVHIYIVYKQLNYALHLTKNVFKSVNVAGISTACLVASDVWAASVGKNATTTRILIVA